MNSHENEEIEVCEFPQCMKYVKVYRIFCDVFELGEKREKLQVLKDGIIIDWKYPKEESEDCCSMGYREYGNAKVYLGKNMVLLNPRI